MSVAEPRLPRFTGWLGPVVDAAARIRASVHVKLLSGFMVGALLLVAMAVLSLVVIGQMNERVQDLDRLQMKTSRAQQMLYAVTAQSHYRAMALLTRDPKYNDKIAEAKATFVGLLDAMERDDAGDAQVLSEMRAANDRLAAASREVLGLYVAGDMDAASKVHLDQEHPLTHVLEDALNALIVVADRQMAEAQAAFEADRTLLTTAVVAFSVVAVAVALLLGFVLSWAIIRPIRKMAAALGGITAGELTQKVDVPNRDELGQLARDLNGTSARLTELFEEQRALASRLEESNASLARASEAKSRFLASVSHELRTPMNAILGFTDALLAGVDGPLNADQTASLEWVQRGGRDLLGLINEILDLSKIEAGRLTIDAQPFDPRELVEAVVAQSRSLAAQKGLRLVWVDAGGPTEVVLDRQRVGQILVNLIGNALKFTGQGEVRVETSGADASRFRVAVQDTGPGIAPDLHEAIFEEFRQVDGEQAGTGLGLPISRRLARVMGGDITLDSTPGQGSTFYLTLPIDCRLEPVAPAAAEPGRPLDGTRVLLSVDDDPSVAPLLAKMVTGHGYRVVAAGPGAAVGEARRLQPAAILLDVLMPGRDGRDLLRELKADPQVSSIPVIVLSVVDAAEVPGLADGYLAKPVRQDRLLGLLDERCAPAASAGTGGAA